jgi:hypothetical protein
MPNLDVIGKWIVILGIVIVIVGGIIWLLGRIPGLHNLPGTIKIQGSGFTVIIPLLTMIILSVVLTIFINIILRIGKH